MEVYALETGNQIPTDSWNVLNREWERKEKVC